MLLNDIVEKLSLRIIGGLSKDITVTGIGSLSGAKDTEISFIMNRKYLKYIATTRARAVIMDYEALKQELPPVINFLILDSKNPYLAFARATQLFYPEDHSAKTLSDDFLNLAGVDKTALIGMGSTLYPGVFVGAGSSLGANCSIMGNVFLGKNVIVGDNVVIHPNVSIYDNSKIGNNCIIHSGSVVGSDGFGYAPDKNKYIKIIHSGYAVLEDDVELGANVTVDRGVTDFTKIGTGTKVDNLVQIAHNVIIGSNCVIAAQTGIAGSTTIGDNVTIGGQVGITGHITIGNGVVVAAQSGVVNNVRNNDVISGTPAIPIKNWRSSVVLFKKLPELFKRTRDIEKKQGI